MITLPDETAPANETATERHLRRKEAAKYVVETYNVPCSPRTLAKLACVSSTGPPFRLAGRFLCTRSRVSMPGRLPRLAPWSGQHQKPAPPINSRSIKPGGTIPWRDRRAHRAEKGFHRGYV
jgi:hypothetical protein